CARDGHSAWRYYYGLDSW
nr:immunoglobulin heavy chain junction region [Macaca mulatta]MOW98139.1 immunoglobulin heavy chain junction region [Macaca mulatta]MOW98158.1 immunoglobulin heavy chain junction region [Macaca mulatta]MOW98389.1 immunoglobulin heavy chain junction region [Macaca mulatta]MOW98630.1 immunoglobulin heavy chain junction region [Macaca mulatta]